MVAIYEGRSFPSRLKGASKLATRRRVTQFAGLTPTGTLERALFVRLSGIFARTDFSLLWGRALQVQPAKQLCIRGHDDRGEAHCDCTSAHGQIESPSDEKASRDRDGDKIIGGRPNEILNHLPISSPR